MEKLLEGRAELVDHAVHELRRLLDQFNNRITLRDLRLVERYVKAEIVLLVRSHLRGPDKEYIAHLQREQPIGNQKVGKGESLDGSKGETFPWKATVGSPYAWPGPPSQDSNVAIPWLGIAVTTAAISGSSPVGSIRPI